MSAAERKTDFRLPDGAQFSAVYDAANVLWSGRLILPAQPHVGTAGVGPMIFAGQGGGVFMLLQKLDRQYRKHMNLPGAKRGSKGGAKKGKQL